MCSAWHPWLQIAVTRAWPTQVPHTTLGCWLLAAVDPLGATVELAGPQAVASPSQCSLEETFSVIDSHFPKFRIPSQPTRQIIAYQEPYTLVTPPAILIPPSGRLSSQLQPGISSLQPNPTSKHPKHRTAPPASSSVCTLTLLRHPHFGASQPVRHFRYRPTQSTLQLATPVTRQHQHFLHFSVAIFNSWIILGFASHYRDTLQTRRLNLILPPLPPRPHCKRTTYKESTPRTTRSQSFPQPDRSLFN